MGQSELSYERWRAWAFVQKWADGGKGGKGVNKGKAGV